MRTNVRVPGWFWRARILLDASGFQDPQMTACILHIFGLQILNLRISERFGYPSVFIAGKIHFSPVAKWKWKLSVLLKRTHKPPARRAHQPTLSPAISSGFARRRLFSLTNFGTAISGEQVLCVSKAIMLETAGDCVEESSDVPPNNCKEADLKKEKTLARRRTKNPLLTSITVRQLKALLKSHNEEKPKRMVVRRARKPSTDKRGRPRKKQFGGAWDADAEKPSTSKLRVASMNDQSSALSVPVEGIAGQFGIFQWNLLESFQLLFKFAGLLPLPSRQRRGRQIHASDETLSVEPGSTYMTYCESLLQKAEDLIARNASLEAPEKDKNVEDVGSTAFTIAEPCQLHRKPYDWLTDYDIEALIGSFAPYST
uniref:40S ribosomal protein S19-binding protein 1 n=1 Tax=Ascaris lumbricoides TaxID=6252 RepID=A0A0M3HS50_ASCLU